MPKEEQKEAVSIVEPQQETNPATLSPSPNTDLPIIGLAISIVGVIFSLASSASIFFRVLGLLVALAGLIIGLITLKNKKAIATIAIVLSAFGLLFAVLGGNSSNSNKNKTDQNHEKLGDAITISEFGNAIATSEIKGNKESFSLVAEQKANTEKPKEYKIIKREANAEVTDESLNALVDYATAKNVIGDVAAFQKQLEEKMKNSAKEVILRVLVAPGLKKEDLSKIVSVIIQDESARDKEADQLFIFAYDKEGDAKNESDALALIRWGPKDKKLTEKVVEGNDRSNYEVEWQHESGRLRDPSVGYSEVPDLDREIFYYYWETKDSIYESSDLLLEEASEKAKRVVAKKFNIGEDQVLPISDKVMESKPTDFETKVANALEKKFDEKRDKNGLVGEEKEKEADKEVAKMFNISVIRVNAIWGHVIYWEGKRS